MTMYLLDCSLHTLYYELADRIKMSINTLRPEKLWFEYDHYQQQKRFLNLSQNEKEIVEKFKQEGCFLYKKALHDHDIETVNSAIDTWIDQHAHALISNRKPDGTYPRLIGLHEEVPAIEALFSNDATLKLQDLLFGCRSSLHTSITFLQGSQQELHRDIPVFNLSPHNLYFRIWVALEDVTSENGPLFGVKGGHKVGIERDKIAHKFYSCFDDIPELNPTLWRQHQQTLQKNYEEEGLTEENFELSKGDILIWHPLFPHGGNKIKNKNLSRRSIVLHVSIR